MRRIIDAARWCLLRYMFAISARHVKAGRPAQAAEFAVLGMRWSRYTRVVVSWPGWKPESAE